MDLEHCPFCGVKPHHVDGLATDSGARDRIGKYAWIECGCGARGPDVRVNYGDVDGWQDKVTDEWNTRAPDAAARAPKDPVAELREAYRDILAVPVSDHAATTALARLERAITALEAGK